MQSIDLNCDMGELKPGKDVNFDQEIIPYISSANIACGFHSGDPQMIEQTIRLALRHDVAIGAHPSYDDRAHFGRRSLDIEVNTLMAQIRYQICAVQGICESLGGRLAHIKPHGALYNDMSQSATLSLSLIELIHSIDPSLKVFALAHSQMFHLCKANDINVVAEGFADRRYQSIDALRSRSLDGAVLHNEDDVLDQVTSLLDGKVMLHDKTTSAINVQSICLHSDTQGAAELSKKIYHHVQSLNVEIAAH